MKKGYQKFVNHLPHHHLMQKLMANFQVFQTIYHANFCISTGIKTAANFLITDIEKASFIAWDCRHHAATYY